MDFFICKEEIVSIQNLMGSRLTCDDSFPCAPLLQAKTPPYLRGKKEPQVHAACVFLQSHFLYVLGIKIYASSCSHKRQATECEVARNIELAIRGIEEQLAINLNAKMREQTFFSRPRTLCLDDLDISYDSFCAS
jgi:hypothetical protein